ncbi:hypothetical protein JCM8097_000061 [Rhodosporidiobolus ruineniae]
MTPPAHGVCCVCGKETTQRCGACGKAGFDLFFCSTEHQRMVWFAHKRVCGWLAKPFCFPPLDDEERSQLSADLLKPYPCYGGETCLVHTLRLLRPVSSIEETIRRLAYPVDQNWYGDFAHHVLVFAALNYRESQRLHDQERYPDQPAPVSLEDVSGRRSLLSASLRVLAVIAQERSTVDEVEGDAIYGALSEMLGKAGVWV